VKKKKMNGNNSFLSNPVYGILECDAVNSGTSVPTFRRSPLSRTSRLTLKFLQSVSSEAIAPIFDTPRPHTPEDRSLVESDHPAVGHSNLSQGDILYKFERRPRVGSDLFALISIRNISRINEMKC
jgi:hypothetical protein